MDESQWCVQRVTAKRGLLLCLFKRFYNKILEGKRQSEQISSLRCSWPALPLTACSADGDPEPSARQMRCAPRRHPPQRGAHPRQAGGTAERCQPGERGLPNPIPRRGGVCPLPVRCLTLGSLTSPCHSPTICKMHTRQCLPHGAVGKNVADRCVQVTKFHESTTHFDEQHGVCITALSL